MRVLGVGVLFIVAVVATTYAVEALAPDLPPWGRSLVMAPVFVVGGLSVRAAAVRRRAEKSRREVS
ncbi:hypothetical protein [Isoptericola sp. NPDC057559]|uniref:hypothetical protein n=1 Tax=Isoptericola sp. NPDC057559 TaxID=3346168 RepID=UPI00369C97C9